jgi:hypothetical protein
MQSVSINGTIPFSYSKFDKIVVEWMPPLMFSLLIVVLLFAILKVTQIHYSRTVIQRLTPYPYYVILIYLSTEAI